MICFPSTRSLLGLVSGAVCWSHAVPVDTQVHSQALAETLCGLPDPSRAAAVASPRCALSSPGPPAPSGVPPHPPLPQQSGSRLWVNSQDESRLTVLLGTRSCGPRQPVSTVMCVYSCLSRRTGPGPVVPFGQKQNFSHFFLI